MSQIEILNKIKKLRKGQIIKVKVESEQHRKAKILLGTVHDISSSTITIQLENYKTGINIKDLITKRVALI